MANPKPHAIVFPYPYQGHITPTINLSLKLATNGFIITFVQAEFIHHSTSKAHNLNSDADIFVEAQKLGLDIRYTTISDGFPVDFDRHMINYHQYWETMFRQFPSRVEDLVVAKIVGDEDPTSFFLVTDTFYSWIATPICKKYGLINVSLWTEPALVFSINYNLDLIRNHGHFPSSGNGDNLINYIPGVETIRTADLMSYVQYPDMIPMLTEVVVKGFDHVKEADFILCNTIEELEFGTLSTLNQIHPTFAVGPINFYTQSGCSVAWSLTSETDCAEWLDSKPHGSVLYISFGSIVMSSKEEAAEFFHGLLRSEVCFIWVIKTDTQGDDQTKRILPSDFEEAIGDRGLIVPWCDQNRVLSNPAVGGFLTHCGWNSILESIWHGVPMICHPFLVDQPTNRKLVVDDWKIGINLCDDGGGVVGREEVFEKINVLMKGESSDEIKYDIRKVRKKLQDSLCAQGSSQRNFDRFVEDLRLKLSIYRHNIIWNRGFKVEAFNLKNIFA